MVHCQWPQSLVPLDSMNSFGFGGANSHAILEAPHAHTPVQNRHAALLNGILFLFTAMLTVQIICLLSLLEQSFHSNRWWSTLLRTSLS